MANASFSLSGCLDKMSNRDKDFRYMALSDLLVELEKDTFRMDADSEKKICSAIVKLLDDTSGDVQGLAVKCLGPLTTKVKEAQIQEIVDTLADMVTNSKKDTLRDIAGMGFKPVITQIDPKSAPMLVERVTPKLITGINSNEKQTTNECLNVLSDLLGRFATLMTRDHEKIQKAIIPQLTSSRPATRKKAISCLGYLSISTPDDLFSSLVTTVLKEIKTSKKANTIRTFISVIGAISRSVGYRLGKFLESENIIPLLITNLNDSQFDTDEELKENCFQTFESLILRSPKEIKPYLDSILQQCLKYIQWDPNVAGGSGDEGGEEFSGGEEEFSEEDADDDDMSWKVRRAAAKCLTSIINTRPDLLPVIYQKVVPALINRFKEREEPVKLDIFEVFTSVLKQTVVVGRGAPITADDNPINLLKSNVSSVITSLVKELKSKSLKTKVGAFQVLKELVNVHPGLLSDQLASLIPGVKDSLEGKATSSNLKIEVLGFLSLAVANHGSGASAQKFISQLVDPVLKSVNDTYYKITAEALRVTRALIKAVRPVEGTPSSDEWKGYTNKIYSGIISKFESQDIDQEVKESAISCVGSLIAHMGDALAEDSKKKALSILLDRLKNEITRLTTVNVLIEIATSPLNIDISAILGDAVSELADYLRQNSRQLKQSCLRALDVLIRQYGQKVDQKLYGKVLKEAGALISEADLHISHLSLRLVEAVIRADKNSVANVQEFIYPKVLSLVQSSLLQGLALESLFGLYSVLVSQNAKKFGFDELLNSLLGMQLKSSTQTRQSLNSIAQCVAAICVNAPQDKRDATVEKFISDIKKSKSSSGKIQALLCLGEIGRRVDLSTHKNIQKTITSAFDGTEDERNAASFCLGCVSVGNVAQFLPFVLGEIKNEPGKQYLLMHSLREIISRASSAPAGIAALTPHLESVLRLLFENTQSEEEGTRNVVAECLGKLCLINPTQLIPALRERIKDQSPQTRSTVVTAVKFAITDKPHAVDDALAPIFGEFLTLLSDEDLLVRRSTLLTLNFAAHNKPILVRPVLQKHMPALYEESKVKESLIKVVDLGPFKHRLDTGLENRKAAYECLYTLLETCIDKIEISTFVEHLVAGLGDTYDIKLLCQLMLVRLALSAGVAMLTSLDVLVEPLKKTITSKAKENAVQQEVEKNDELVRSALRAVAAISLIPDVDSSLKFSDFLKTTVKTGPLAPKFEEMVKQTQSGSA